MGKLFGTDGVRGKANIFPMDSDSVLKLARASAEVMKPKRVLIGKDTRISGYMLETALASGFVSMGVDVLLCGPIPTPAVAFMTRSMRADAGVMISASHNPFEDNGIKFFGPDGFKLPDETESKIEAAFENSSADASRVTPELIGKAYRIDDAVGRYTVYLKSCLPKQSTFDGLKVVLDTANGAAYKIAPLVFKELGAEIITAGDKPDGRNINLGVGSLHPEVISKLVVETKADVGIAYDGDADRVLMCDENGKLIDGDLILAICASEAKERGLLKGSAVVGTIMSNFGLEKALEKEGIKLARAAVGDRYVLAEMLKSDLNFGGEQSGHIISLDHNTTGDGILTSLLVLSFALDAKKSLSSYQSLIEPFPQQLINIPVKDKPPLEEISSVATALKEAEEKLANSGRIVLRYSGTEPKARVMVECSDASLCKSVAEQMAEVIRSAIGS